MKKHAVVAIVIYQGKILVGKKRRDSQKILAGEWHIPGETVENNETDEEALRRGIREEAELEIRVEKYIGSHVTPTNQRETRWYECFAETNQVVCGSDLEDIKWIERTNVLDFCSLKATFLWPNEIQDYFR